MQAFFDEQSFERQKDGSFLNDKKSVKVAFDEKRQVYALSLADVEEGKVGDYAEIETWLFDDSQVERDAEAVGIDFVNTLRKNMGVKVKRNSNSANVELPTASKGDSITVTGFTKKMLDFFPALKDEYKNHIADNGSFLYLNFFGEFLVPQIKAVFSTGTKKQIKKLFELLDDLYVKGDRDTVNVIVAVVCAAGYKNESVYNGILETFAEDKHFRSSIENFMPVLAKNKKLLAALVK